jgi:site-specific recombinase XerC
MCYKTEKQKKEKLKLKEKINDLPKFIKDYFSYLNSNVTKLNNCGIIRSFLEWLISEGIIKNSIVNITPSDLSLVTDIDLIEYLSGLNNSLSSINTKKNVISGFWAYLLDKEYVKTNIVNKKLHDKFKAKDKEVVVPTDEDIYQFIVNINNIKNETIALRNIAIVRLFMGSGIRIEELVGLDVIDLHFENEDEPYVVVMGKGIQDEDDKQNVAINKAAMDAINDYLQVRNTIPDIKETKALFISEQLNKETGKRTRVAQSSIQDFFRKYSNGAIHPHLLRHYAGTKMYENSNDIVAVAAQLRHGDVNTSRKFYIKNNKSATYKALNSF